MVFQITNYEIGELEIMTDIIEDVVFDCDYAALSEKYKKELEDMKNRNKQIETINTLKIFIKVIFGVTIIFVLINCIRFQEQLLSMNRANRFLFPAGMCLLTYIISSTSLSKGINIPYYAEKYDNILDFYSHYKNGTLRKVQREYASYEHEGFIKYSYVDTHNEIREKRFFIDDAVTLDNISSNRLCISLDGVIYQRKFKI